MKQALAWLALGVTLPLHAIDHIRLRAGSINTGDIQAADVDVALTIQDATHSAVALRASQLKLPPDIEAQTGKLQNLRLQCTNPVVHEPRFDCPAFSLRVDSSRWPDFAATGEAALRSDSLAWQASGSSVVITDQPLAYSIHGDADGMQAQLSLRALQLSQVKDFLLAQKLPIPDLTYTGHGDLTATVTQRATSTTADLQLSLREAGYQNADFTLIGEKLALSATAHVDVANSPMAFDVQLAGEGGQALAGPVLLDFNNNPLQVSLSGSYTPEKLRITALHSTQRDLATFIGTAVLDLAPFAVQEASIDISDIRFPAAYTSFVQLALAATPFNQLTASGTATMHAELRDDQLTQLDLTVNDLAFSDTSRELKVDGVQSQVHWTAGLNGPPRPSWLSWESSRGWGIVGAATRLDFIAQDHDLRLTQPARLPFFDGALRINTLAAEHIGTDSLSGVFDAVVEPISVAPIAKAMGLPEFSGRLSGRIPGVTYRDKTLSLQGNLETDVFDGHLVASNLRIRDPLGAWPRLYGDITARNLDLSLVTDTFEFGGITGRLNMDLLGLETFNWSPIALDLSIATPDDDHSRHRISQRAVQNLSDIGGGGGVAAVLQSGFLRFFEDFGYDRIGLSCRLRNDICQMGGVGTANGGFYIVKGSGIPRIDIIGNNRLVDWPTLLAQIRDAVRNPGNIQLK